MGCGVGLGWWGGGGGGGGGGGTPNIPPLRNLNRAAAAATRQAGIMTDLGDGHGTTGVEKKVI